MSEKPVPIFVGNVKPGRWEGTFDIGFTRAHLDLLLAKLEEGGKEWVNVQLKHSRTSGKPYMEIRAPYVAQEAKQQAQPEQQPEDDGSQLPF